ncbi:hypothetical protein H6P81_009088 [Aristolochia fimbriata]|uniref:Golgin-84 n=1 Tax=Aristolochia fimbriata TaxID=158543 RepID=A0AAV7EJV9_ARIFI|nr:hypothetical protein H6P81_009088 [Aristolochia fimbriata]
MASWLKVAEDLFEVVDRRAKLVVSELSEEQSNLQPSVGSKGQDSQKGKKSKTSLRLQTAEPSSKIDTVQEQQVTASNGATGTTVSKDGVAPESQNTPPNRDTDAPSDVSKGEEISEISSLLPGSNDAIDDTVSLITEPSTNENIVESSLLNGGVSENPAESHEGPSSAPVEAPGTPFVDGNHSPTPDTGSKIEFLMDEVSLTNDEERPPHELAESQEVLQVKEMQNLQEPVLMTQQDQKDDSSAKSQQEQITAAKSQQEQITAAKSQQEQITAAKSQQEQITAAKSQQEQITAAKSQQEQTAAAKSQQEQTAAAKSQQEQKTVGKSQQEQKTAAKSQQELKSVAKSLQEQITASENTLEPKDDAAPKTQQEQKSDSDARAQQEQKADVPTSKVEDQLDEAQGLLKSTVSTGQSKEARLARVCAGLSTRLQEYKSENAQLEELLVAERERSSAYEAHVKLLQQELSTSKSTVNKIESSMSDALAAKNSEIASLVTSMEAMKKQLAVSEGQLASLQANMETITRSRELTETRMMQAIREELAAAERRAEEERTAHNATKMAAMEREVELEHRAVEASTALARIQRTVDERTSRASELEQKLALLEVECASLNQELQDMEVRARRGEKRSPEEANQALKMQAWQEEVERARQGQRDAESKLSSMEAELQKIRVEMAGMKRDAEHYSRQEHVELEKRYRDLTDLLYYKQTQLEAMASEKAAAEFQLEKEAKRLQEAQAEAERSRVSRRTSSSWEDDTDFKALEPLPLHHRHMIGASMQVSLAVPYCQSASTFLLGICPSFFDVSATSPSGASR